MNKAKELKRKNKKKEVENNKKQQQQLELETFLKNKQIGEKRNWHKETKENLEFVARRDGDKISEKCIEYSLSRGITCETCRNKLFNIWCYIIPTEDKDKPRFFCQNCGDIITAYYSQLNGVNSDVFDRNIFTFREFHLATGTYGTWKFEVVSGFFGIRDCTNCVFEQMYLKYPIASTRRNCIISVKMLECDMDVSEVIKTAVSYLCKKCADDFLVELKNSRHSLISVEQNVIQQQRLEQKILQMNKGFSW